MKKGAVTLLLLMLLVVSVQWVLIMRLSLFHCLGALDFFLLLNNGGEIFFPEFSKMLDETKIQLVSINF